MSLVIQVSSNAAEVIRQVGGFTARMAAAVAQVMDAENQLSIGHAQLHYLSGPRPLRLGVRTNRLRGSLNASPARIDGNTISSTIGTNVEYAAAHEFGFDGPVSVRQHVRRNPRGDLLSGQAPEVSLATGRITRRRIVKIASGISTVRTHIRQAHIPARPFLSPTLEDRAQAYADSVSAAILESWQEGSA